jgi:SAM-dependent methyltransferase
VAAASPSSPGSGALDRYRTEGGAARYAGKYTRGWTRRETNRRETAILRRMLSGVDPAASLLNLACGAGRFADVLAPPERRRVVFADWSQAMLDEAREQLRAAGHADVELRLVDVTKSKPEESFDVVTCVRLLHHLEGPAFDAAVDFLTGSAKRALVCTFASSATWKGFWKSRSGRPRRGEVLRSPDAMAAAFSARGWRIVEMRRVATLFSTQAWLLLTPAAG